MALSTSLRIAAATAALTAAVLLPSRWANALACLCVVAFAAYEARRMYRADPERQRWHEPVRAVSFYAALAIAALLAVAVVVVLPR
jgi:hypothetical protein